MYAAETGIASMLGAALALCLAELLPLALIGAGQIGFLVIGHISRLFVPFYVLAVSFVQAVLCFLWVAWYRPELAILVALLVFLGMSVFLTPYFWKIANAEIEPNLRWMAFLINSGIGKKLEITLSGKRASSRSSARGVFAEPSEGKFSGGGASDKW